MTETNSGTGKGLAYDSCTWESTELVSKIAQPAIDRYLDRSSQVLRSNKVEANPATRSPHKPIREQPPYLKNGELRDFQVTGLNFLAYNWCKGNNVILADEMGLGKTVQTVSFMNWLRHDRQQQGPFLVVVPLSTIPAWTDTFDHWTPDLNFVVYTGNEAARKTIRDYELWDTDDSSKRWKFNVLLTTYEYINLDIKELMQIKWQFMAVDEAHRLKNRESQLYAKLRDLKAPSRLLITGTPMQNTLGELTALMDFLMPGAVKIDEEINLQSQEAGQMIAELTKAIKPFILRRTKAKVENDLPPKSEKIIRVELADVQRTHYKNIITRNYAALNQGAKGPKQSLLNIVMELRKASNHPFMFENVKERILNGSDRREDLLKGLITSSGKMMLLDRLLTKLKKDGHRVLIFSQMVKMLDILSEYLQLRGYQFQRLDGTIAAGPRRIAIDHFNAPESNDFCFLLSTRAGGLGINLMTADTVILFDADWNPHADLQAMARAHRIGQKKPVSVYRFVAKDSIEEDVLLRARNKLLLEFITIQRGVTDESSKQYSDLVAKAGSNVAEPTAPDDISRILKHRSQKMFEESSTQKKLEELDIDAVLEDAEEHKIEGPTGLEADGGEEFLKSFNYMDVKLDPEWDDIIPPEQLVEIKAEAKRSADERYLDEVIQQNAPRKRKAADNERGERAQKRAREMTAAEAREGVEEGESSDDDPSRPLTEKELRDLFRGFLRYGSLDDRTDEILREANLVGRDLNLLREALDEITALSKRLLQEERARVRAFERAHQKALTKKDKKAVLFDYKGVKRLNAETILDRPGEMSLLREVVDGCPKVEHFRVPEASKAAHYSCTWGAREDGMLLVGILRHGYGAWSAIRDDPDLGMSDKLFLEEQRVAKKEERTKADGAANKMAKSPGAVHLVRRADYLLSVLKERRSGIDSQTPEQGSVSPSPARGDAGRNHRHEAGPSSAATPTTTTNATGGGRAGLKRKSGNTADSDLVRSKRPRTLQEDGRPVEAGLDEEAILQSLFRPVRESLGLVRSATKEGVPCKTERAKILRRELLRIGTHISTLVKGVEDGPALEGRLWYVYLLFFGSFITFPLSPLLSSVRFSLLLLTLFLYSPLLLFRIFRYQILRPLQGLCQYVLAEPGNTGFKAQADARAAGGGRSHRRTGQVESSVPSPLRRGTTEARPDLVGCIGWRPRRSARLGARTDGSRGRRGEGGGARGKVRGEGRGGREGGGRDISGRALPDHMGCVPGCPSRGRREGRGWGR